MTRSAIKAAVLSLSMIIAGCVTAPGDQSLSAPPLKVNGALGVVELAPVHVATAHLYGPDYRIGNGGVPSLIGPEPQADVATNAETQALRQSVKRPDIRIIQTIVEGRYRIVARRSAGIAKLADLKGKRVATMNDTSAEYFLYKMLKSAGLSQSDITQRSVLPLQDMVKLIDSREVDAVAIWEPFSEDAARVLGSDLISFSGAGIYRELFNLNTTAAALADPVRRPKIVRLVREIMDQTTAMNRDPSAAQTAVSRSAGYTIDQLRDAWPHHGWVANFADDMLDVLTEEEAWLAAKERRAPRTREQLAPLIDRSVYEEALRLR